MGGDAGGQLLQPFPGKVFPGLGRVGDDPVNGEILNAAGLEKPLFSEEWHK